MGKDKKVQFVYFVPYLGVTLEFYSMMVIVLLAGNDKCHIFFLKKLTLKML